MGCNYPHVFEPIRIRGIDFKNRITLAPPSPNLAGANGQITPEFINWFRMFARGGVCTMYVGNASIDLSESKDEAYQLNLNNDDVILNLSRFADMGKQYGCHASLEICHNGENTAYETFGKRPYSSSELISATEKSRAAQLGREPIPSIAMDHAKIKETVEKYGDAALRMKKAGMDIVLLHGGHGNLISQFTSPLYNHRTDEYGGSLENRARFAIEVCDCIREKCGENFVIEFRISADEIAEQGMHIEETLELIGLIKDHIDILHVSAGLHTDFDMKYYRNWCQNYMMDRGFNVHYAAEVKKKYPDLLVTTVGSITSIEMAEEIIASGQADFVAMCRPLMADPDMPNKYAHNLPEDRRPCLRCNTCTRHLFVPKPIYCAINPISGLTDTLPDGRVPKAEVRKKCAVVGGGPGGIQALITLCERGHDVTLYEMSGELGGNVIGAAAPPFKIDCQDYLAYIRRQAQKCVDKYGAKILLNTKATKEMLDAENYDAVIIAIGADPLIPKSIPGIDMKHVAWAPDAELGHVTVGDKIVIVGAGSVGVETAIEFAEQGKKVEIIEMNPEPVATFRLIMSIFTAAGDSLEKLGRLGVKINFGTKISEVKEDKVICEALDGSKLEIEADTVLLAMGLVSRQAEADTMRHCAPETDVRIIGDVDQIGTISEAVNGAFQAALHI